MTAILWGLLGGATQAWTPPDDAPPLPGSGGVPAPWDAEVLALRPPLTDRIVRVGPERTFTTIQAGVVAARAQHDAAKSAGADEWVTVLIDPGIYPDEQGRIDNPSLTAFISASGQPHSVTVLAGWGAFAPLYIEGIDADARVSPVTKYGMHLTNWDSICVIAGGGLSGSASDIGSGWPMGTDGGPGGYCLLYETVLTGVGRTNNHGPINPSGMAADMPGYEQVYVRTRFEAGGVQFQDASPLPSALWTIDCTAQWAGISAQNGSWYESGSTWTSTAPGAYQAAQPLPASDWPRPTW